MYQKRTPSVGTPSVYSHVTRSTSNLKSTRSLKSLKLPWYQRPILQNAYIIDIQRGSFFTGIYSLVLSIFTVITAVFDVYSLAMAAPGSTHYGYYFISYQFVYVGNRHVRNTLILFALFSIISALSVLVTSIMLIMALRKEHEKKVVPWLYCFAIFTIFRTLAWIFFSVVNDLIFAYNILTALLWAVLCPMNVYGWLLVYSLYLELTDLTKLEDLAHLREHEKKVVPWLYCFAIFTIFRTLAWIFFSVVNDLIFAYNILTALLWAVLCPMNVYGWLLVYSLYLELTDLTKLEDLAHLRLSTMASIAASTNASIAGSRPTTPHSTVYTIPTPV